MAITTKNLTDSWQAITAAGESGTCWPVEFRDLADAVDQADAIIYHTDAGLPTGDNNIEQSKRLYKPSNNNDVILLTADTVSDIFYARCKTSGAKLDINVDVV